MFVVNVTAAFIGLIGSFNYRVKKLYTVYDWPLQEYIYKSEMAWAKMANICEPWNVNKTQDVLVLQS